MDQNPALQRYKLIISYDGTKFCGWQVQQNQTAIQPLVQKTLETVLRHPIDLTGSGRTDSGVHALGQTAHFDSSVSIDLKKILLSLNALLPSDIRIRSIEPVDQTFHARYSVIAKEYHYRLRLDPIADPFAAPYQLQVFEKIDLALLKRGCSLFLGTHDFTSFANEAYRGSAAKDPIRTIFRLDLILEEGGARLEFEGDGFLYKMVRNMVGTLLEYGKGKLKDADIDAIFAAKDRRKAGPAVPPRGLCLVSVKY